MNTMDSDSLLNGSPFRSNAILGAILGGDLFTVKAYLLAGLDPNIRGDNDNRSTLSYAMECERLKVDAMVEVLVTHGGSHKREERLLHKAVHMILPKSLKLLLQVR